MFSIQKSPFIITIILLLTLFVSACGANNEENNSESADNQDEKAQDVRTVEHAMDKTDIEGTPKRVVTLYQGATDAAVALGVKPVGVVDSWVQQPMYKYLRDDLEGVKRVGTETQPNLEEISKLNPDLIIASKLRHEEVYEQLSKIAPTVTHETVFKFKETLDLVGKAVNKQDKADQLLADWDNRVADFQKKIKEKKGDDWPIEVSVLNFRTDHARIYITGFAGDILTELGFVRPEEQQKEAEKGTVVQKLTSKESIPAMNADVFFIFNSDGHNADAEAIQKTYEDWTSHPLWKNLDAVQKDQAYIVDDVAWNMGGGYLAANNMLDQIYDRFGLEKQE